MEDSPQDISPWLSGGAQFSHRFTFQNTRLVGALSAHSAGSWDSPSGNLKEILFSISCGEEDKERIGGFREFSSRLKGKSAEVDSQIFPGVGHQLTSEALNMAKNLFEKFKARPLPDDEGE